MANNKKKNVTNKKDIVTETKEESKNKKTEIAKQDITIALLVIACLILIIILIVVIKGHEAKLQDGKEIIASVEGKEITSEDLFDELKRQYGTNILINTIDDYIANKEVPDTDAAKEYAKAQVASLKQQWGSMGYDFNTVLTNYGYENENELLELFASDYKKNEVVKKYLNEHLTDDEINGYYENEIYGKTTVKHILIKPDTTSTATSEEKSAAEEAAKARANEVIQKLNEGAAWADLVNEYSADTASVPDEGLISFEKGDVVDEFFDASIKLNDNEYTQEPVKSTYGYHIILRVSQEEKPTLESVIDTVKNNLVTNKLADDANLANNVWVNVRKDYKLEINDTKIEKIYNSIISEYE